MNKKTPVKNLLWMRIHHNIYSVYTVTMLMLLVVIYVHIIFILTFIWFSYNVASIMCNNNDNQIVKGQLFVQSAGPVLRERWQTVVIWTCLQEDRRFIWMQSKLNTKGRLYIQYILLFSSLFCSCWTVSSSGSDGRCSLVLMALDWGNYVH